ncbi:uncharacterized protein Triagg1_1252 [Trichoderma aggressivum f. europaeum]|uniref:Uncharacterized protein n=1 Tax=Trichoderma aggressivum f. europaeum TaxID=173218 RepID=A0AAE1M8Z6_9HYPO|nr:hypothetical protein Triagg1_1252 [Trichoderma aggressivum f. europaeum]
MASCCIVAPLKGPAPVKAEDGRGWTDGERDEGRVEADQMDETRDRSVGGGGEVGGPPLVLWRGTAGHFWGLVLDFFVLLPLVLAAGNLPGQIKSDQPTSIVKID